MVTYITDAWLYQSKLYLRGLNDLSGSGSSSEGVGQLHTAMNQVGHAVSNSSFEIEDSSDSDNDRLTASCMVKTNFEQSMIYRQFLPAGVHVANVHVVLCEYRSVLAVGRILHL